MPRKKTTNKEAEEKKETKAKPAAKKTSTAKKSTTTKKPAAKKTSTAKKSTTAAKKPAAKKTSTAKKSTTTKKPAAKKTSTAKKSTTTKKPAAKKTSTAKKSTTTTKKPAAKKTSTAKKPTTKKSSAVPDAKYSDEDLEMFRSVIDVSRREALEELRMLKERLEDLTNYDFAEESMIYSMHMAEQGSEALEKEKTYAQIQRIHEYIKKLDEAIERIEDKTYGVCRVCGCLIAKERLLAVPITTLSASYKIHQKCPEDGIDRIEPVKT